VGVQTYRRESNKCELAFIAALERHDGVGTAIGTRQPSTTATGLNDSCRSSNKARRFGGSGRVGGWRPG
jgi:hypothetical protein